MTPTTNRETWLNDMAALMAPRFAELGFPLPKYRVAVGWTSAGKTSAVGGECWHSSRSADGAFEILCAPIIDKSMDVAGTLAHELTHAAVGFDCGHKGDFKKVCLALGLKGPMTATTPGQAFIDWAQPFIDRLGHIPHARIMLAGNGIPRDAGADGEAESGDVPEKGSSNQKPKQSTRMLKAACTAMMDNEPCGYTVRLTKKWALKLGACCPVHGALEIEGMDEPSEDDADA